MQMRARARYFRFRSASRKLILAPRESSPGLSVIGRLILGLSDAATCELDGKLWFSGGKFRACTARGLVVSNVAIEDAGLGIFRGERDARGESVTEWIILGGIDVVPISKNNFKEDISCAADALSFPRFYLWHFFPGFLLVWPKNQSMAFTYSL